MSEENNKNQEPVLARAYSTSSFEVYEDQTGALYILGTDCDVTYVIDTVREVAFGPGKRPAPLKGEDGNEVDALALQHFWDHFDVFMRAHNTRSCEEVDELRTWLKQNSPESVAGRKKRFEEGRLFFSDIPLYFKTGSRVVFREDGEECGGEVEFCIPTQSGLRIRMVVVSHLSPAERGFHFVHIDQFPGSMQIDELPLQMMTDECEERLAARGRALVQLFKEGTSYLSYTGNLGRLSAYGGMTYMSATGRVLVDPVNYLNADPDGAMKFKQRHGVGMNPARSGNGLTVHVADEYLSLVMPFVWGFSFRAKTWGRMVATKLKSIEFQTGAFDSLKIDKDRKELIHSLVVGHGAAPNDWISGKGEGTIFLCSGPPGIGKTLTAEAVAETLQRPLYAVGVGELGTTPEQLEKSLSTVLETASTWEAILLLDEADIFLEQRTSNDVHRNAMVAIFLRLLEYYQGILFLTSNRADEIDEAFLSRIDLWLKYSPLTERTRSEIWKSLLERANLTVSPATLIDLATYPLNGREIKNKLKMAQRLAAVRGVELDESLLHEVVSFGGHRRLSAA